MRLGVELVEPERRVSGMGKEYTETRMSFPPMKYKTSSSLENCGML